ncbi:MAG: hypothetical protein HC888_17555 [Candidatus Competibacteraceae bacterium]|nr:hypothetical protein [Candidatus Competibacteraceae bacterium]
MVETCASPDWDQNAFRASADDFAEEIAKDCGPMRPEHKRVTRFFGIAAMAGCFAAQQKVFPYTEEEVLVAVRAIHRRWLASAFTLTETDRALAALHDLMARESKCFWEADPSLFTGVNSGKQLGWRTRNCPGHKGESFYVFAPSYFREICEKEGANLAAVTARLVKMGMMPVSKEKSPKHQVHWAPAHGKRARYYFVKEEFLDWDLEVAPIEESVA